jgi:hypothetical protein
VPGCGENVGKEETLLVGNIVGKGEEVDVAVGDASVLGLGILGAWGLRVGDGLFDGGAVSFRLQVFV